MCGVLSRFVLCAAFFFFEIDFFRHQVEEKRRRIKAGNSTGPNPRAALTQRAIDVKSSKVSPNGNRDQMEQIFLNVLAEFGIDLSRFF